MNERTETEFNPENALIYRRVFPIDRGRVVVEEKWDKRHPHCPFIDNPWNPYAGSLNDWGGIRQVVMTEQEFAEAEPALKANSVAESS